jgi:phosphatidylserine decarboxylase
LAILAFGMGWPLAGFIVAVLTLFFVWFFRDPERSPPNGPELIVAPADGKVVGVVRIDHAPLVNGAAIRVSIFMSPVDVHINRAPVRGVISEIRHQPGKFLAAYKDQAVEQNEQNAMRIVDGAGRNLSVVQVAGFLARRIVCRVNKGDSLDRGERFGLIMFGSRTDLYLPVASMVEITEGQKVKGGETIIGRFA